MLRSGGGAAGGPVSAGGGGAGGAAVTTARARSAGGGSGRYRYLVCLGNNSELPRETLRRRGWWRSTIDDEDAAGHVSTLLPSMIYGGPPRLDYSGHKVMAEAALLGNAFAFCWRPVLGMKLSSGEFATLHSIDPPRDGPADAQLVNHFPTVRCIGSKNGLLRGLQAYYARIGAAVFDHVPTTFVLRDIGRGGSGEYSRFCAHFRRLALTAGDAPDVETMPVKHCHCNLWLVKPVYLNQVRGLVVVVVADGCPRRCHSSPRTASRRARASRCTMR